MPEGSLSSEARGEIELEGNVLVIKRITVTYRFDGAAEHPEAVERVLRIHQDHCPVARTLRGCVDITTRLAED